MRNQIDTIKNESARTRAEWEREKKKLINDKQNEIEELKRNLDDEKETELKKLRDKLEKKFK